MALTRGQKKQRNRETDEAETVTDSRRASELLESRYVYATIYHLLQRPEVANVVLPWWAANKKKWKIQNFYSYQGYVRKIVESHKLTDEQLAEHVVDALPGAALQHENCGDHTLMAVANLWSDCEGTISFVIEGRACRDAMMKGVSTKADEALVTQIRMNCTRKQLHRMWVLASEKKCAMPPPLVNPVNENGGYYSGEAETYRELLQEMRAMSAS